MKAIPVDMEYLAQLEAAVDCMNRILRLQAELILKQNRRCLELMNQYVHRCDDMELLSNQMNEILDLTGHVSDRQQGVLLTLCPPN
ncbi:hypothetical protein WDZ92_15255 [Nostoc sp. NIES-2111]